MTETKDSIVRGPQTAEAEPDLPAPRERDIRSNVTRSGRTVSCVTVESVELNGDTISGETEPRYDGLYHRQPLALEMENGEVVNANQFEFDAALDWEGPLVAFMAHDPDGKAVGIARLPTPYDVTGGMTITVAEGKVSFVEPPKRED